MHPCSSWYRCRPAASPTRRPELSCHPRLIQVPLADLQEELIERVRSDAIPRAGIYYINALHNLEEDDMYEE